LLAFEGEESNAGDDEEEGDSMILRTNCCGLVKLKFSLYLKELKAMAAVFVFVMDEFNRLPRLVRSYSAGDESARGLLLVTVWSRLMLLLPLLESFIPLLILICKSTAELVWREW